MHLAYKCDVCNASFDTEEECLRHENDHKIKKEMLEKTISKFNVGDIIRFKNQKGQTLFAIQSKDVRKNKNGVYEWQYEVQNYAEYWNENGENFVLVLDANEVNSIIADINVILKKYNKCLSINEDNFSCDGFPCFELVFDKGDAE